MVVAENTYCELTFFKDIIANREKEGAYAKLYKLLDRQCNIYLDIDEEELKKQLKENQVLKNLRKRENLSFKSKKDWQSVVSPRHGVDEVFLLDSDKSKQAKQQRAEFGVMVLSNTANDLSYFTKITKPHGFNIVPLKQRNKYKNIAYQDSREEVFKGDKNIELPPYNAIMISDNFMFSEKFDQRKERSLYALIEIFVEKAKDLKRSLDITIFFNNENGYITEEKGVKIRNEIVDEINKLGLNKDINLTLIAHTNKSETHDRKIIMNYEYITSGKGFSVIDNRGVQEIAEGDMQDTLSPSDSLTSIRMRQVQQLSWLEPVYQGKEDCTGSVCFTVGDKKNRLFSDL